MPLKTQYQMCVCGATSWWRGHLDTHIPVTHVQKQMGHNILQVEDKEVWLVYLLGSQAGYLHQWRSFTAAEWLSEFAIHYRRMVIRV